MSVWESINQNKLKWISTYSWGQHDIGWIGYCKYYEKYKLLPNDENFKILDIWYDLARSCGWCYTFENMVFVCEKPCELNLNSDGQLHKDGGMALKYSDGYGLYLLNGTTVPKYLAMTPESDLDVEFFKKEKSADIRAEFIRKFGMDRLAHMGKAIDSYKNYNLNPLWGESEYELIDMSPIFDSIDYAPHLKMTNLTTGVYHLEGVSPECRNLEQALNFRMNGKHKQITTIK